MLDPKEYAYEVFEKHYVNTKRITRYEAKGHALIDVQNTIDALNQVPKYATDEKFEWLKKHYNQVKEHIKQL